jgi:hypothetical protein
MKANPKVYLALFIVGLFLVLQFSCKKDEGDTKPISVLTTITPTQIAHGGFVRVIVVIKNSSEPIVITRVHLFAKIVSGWAVGQPDTDIDVDLSTTPINLVADQTYTFLDQTMGPLQNTGTNTIGVRYTFTAYYEGGSDASSVGLKITKATKKSYSVSSTQVVYDFQPIGK